MMWRRRSQRRKSRSGNEACGGKPRVGRTFLSDAFDLDLGFEPCGRISALNQRSESKASDKSVRPTRTFRRKEVEGWTLPSTPISTLTASVHTPLLVVAARIA